MGQIKEEIKDQDKLLRKFGGHPKYDFPKNYTKSQSHYGDGKYPPDWADRRDAIWWLQDDMCGRCGQPTGRNGHVHHTKKLTEGGSNRLRNLVGLCNECHSLFHPEVDELNADWEEAPQFPSVNAQPQVAVIRRSDDRISEDIDKLASETAPPANWTVVQSPVVHDLSPSVAKELSQAKELDNESFPEKLNKKLLSHNRIPENNTYGKRKVNIDISVSGFLDWTSTFEPEPEIKFTKYTNSLGSFGVVAEEVETSDEYDNEVLISDNVNRMEVSVTDGDGGVARKEIRFTDDNPVQTASFTVSPPSLTISTAKSHLSRIIRTILGYVALFGILFGILGLGVGTIQALVTGSWSNAINSLIVVVISVILIIIVD